MDNFKKITIFYHLFITNGWKEIFNFHLYEIIKSGLYNKVCQIKVGIIYKDEIELEEFKKEFFESYKKITILYERQYDLIPVKVWNDPERKMDIQLGEGETILKMVEYAKENNDEDVYLFFHSKGVTSPHDKSREQISYFYGKGLNKKSSDGEARDFILRDMSYEVIWKWERNIDFLVSNEFYYYIWNFFWVRGSLLKKFDFDSFTENAQFPKIYGLKARHWSAIFPINLFGAVNNIEYKNIYKLIGFKGVVSGFKYGY
jgi:hypothetical protein